MIVSPGAMNRCSRRRGRGAGRRALFQEHADQAHADRGARPDDADAAGDAGCGQGQSHQVEALGPWRGPVGDQRHAEPTIDHHRDRIQRVEFEPFLRPDAGLAQIFLRAAPAPLVAIISDQRLVFEQVMRVAMGKVPGARRISNSSRSIVQSHVLGSRYGASSTNAASRFPASTSA